MNYYQILDVDFESSTKEIKKHYYKLAKKYHPDKTKNIDLEEKFKLLSEAYTTLSNPKKRFIYDIKIKYNLDLEIFNFREEEYELLHSYYNKIMNMTEIKFLKLLFKSLPNNIKSKIFNLSNIKPNTQLLNIYNYRYIDISNLRENYSINLFLKFEDIYFQNTKHLLILNSGKIYYLCVTKYNYKVIINNDIYKFTINIIGELNDFKKNNNNLLYTINLNLYQYYFGDTHKILLLNKEIIFKNDLDKKIVYPFIGLKENGQRGNLIIKFNVDLNKNKICEKNKKLIEDLFNV
uniref:J domain-containing protein n=1 Tax=viral metagenome TaxID=1070528 RepID=A0A6C0BVY4_9ZZZZ